MKIPNYDPNFLTTTDYKQGHPCMPTDVFRMLICGPSNSGKTNVLLHMLYKLLEYDKVYLFSKNLHQNKYRALLQDFPKESTPKLVARSSRRQGMRLFHLKSFRWTTKRLLSLTTWFVKATKTPSSTISATGGTETAALFISLKPFTRYQKASATTSHFCIFAFLPRENKRIADELGVDHQLLDSRQTKNIPSFTMTNHRK